MELLNTYLPFVSAVVSYIFAFAVFRRYAVGRRPYSLLWGAGLVFYALGTTMEALNGLLGWNPTVFRVWYFSGAMMTAAWLGQGTIYLLVRVTVAQAMQELINYRRSPILNKPFVLLLPFGWLRLIILQALRILVLVPLWIMARFDLLARQRVADVLMGFLILLSLIAGFRIFTAELDPSLLQAGQLSGDAIVTPGVRIFTPIFNIYGTVALVGGAIYSAWIFWRKRILGNRVVGNILIALGALSPAWGGTLARLGQPAYLYASELIGAILMFSGFLRAMQKEEKAAEAKPQPAQKPA